MGVIFTWKDLHFWNPHEKLLHISISQLYPWTFTEKRAPLLHSNEKHVNFPINLQWKDGWLRLLFICHLFGWRAFTEGTNIYSFYNLYFEHTIPLVDENFFWHFCFRKVLKKSPTRKKKKDRRNNRQKKSFD